MLFSEDYLKFKHLLVDETCLLIKAKVESNIKNPGRLEVRITSLSLLAEATEKNASEIHILFSLAHLNKDVITQLSGIIKDNPGNSTLLIKINDLSDRMSIALRPRKLRVDASSVVRAVREIIGAEVRVQ